MKSNITQTEDKIQNPTTFGVPEMNKTTGQNTVVPVADVVNANKLNIKTPNLQPTALMSQNLVTMAQEQATKQTELDTIREQKKLDLAKQRSEQEGLVSLVSGQGTKIQTAYDEAIKAMSPLEKEISDLSNTINTRTSQFRNQMIDESGRSIAGEFITGRQAIIQQRASAEIADLSAVLDAKNGQLESAQRKLSQSMEIKQAVFKAEKEAQAIKVDLYKEITGETKEEEVNKLKELEKVEAKFEKEKDDIEQIAMKALSEGAGANEVQKIMNSKSVSEALSASRSIGTEARLNIAYKKAQINALTKKREGGVVTLPQKTGNIVTDLANVISATGAKPKETMSTALGVLSGLSVLAQKNQDKKFLGIAPVRLPAFLSGKERKTERQSNVGDINAINLKVQQWASGASLTDTQIKQVKQLTPDKNDTDLQIVNKSNQLAQYMVSQVQSELANQGIAYELGNVDLYTNDPLELGLEAGDNDPLGLM